MQEGTRVLAVALSNDVFDKLDDYEFRPTILTTNQSFSKWPDVFGDAVIANAIIDRLVHHCEIIKITGHSYRVKDRNLFDEDAEAKL